MKISLPFWLRNLGHRVRGWKQEMLHLGNLGVRSELSAVVYRADGSVLDLGVISRRVVTTAGVNYLASCFLNTNEPESFNFHGCGTGAVAEAVGDTTLGAQVGTRSTGTQSNPSANVYQTVGTISFSGANAITEHGVFSASTVGTLLDRSVFTAINVVNGDSIVFTYQLTITAGG